MPIAASSSDNKPKEVIRTAGRLRKNIIVEFATRASIVVTSYNARVGSIARIALRTVFASDDGSTAVRTSTLTLLFASRASAAHSLLLLETHKERRCKNHLKRPFFVSYQ
jgi:hypothetical protein